MEREIVAYTTKNRLTHPGAILRFFAARFIYRAFTGRFPWLSCGTPRASDICE